MSATLSLILLFVESQKPSAEPRFDVVSIECPEDATIEKVRFGPGGQIALGDHIWANGKLRTVPHRGHYEKREVYGSEAAPKYVSPPPPTVTCFDARGNYAGYYSENTGGLTESHAHRAFVYRNGKTRIYLSPDRQQEHSEITGMTDSGDMVGLYRFKFYLPEAFDKPANKGFVVKGGKARTIGFAEAMFINRQGMIAGYYTTDAKGRVSPILRDGKGDAWFLLENGKQVRKGNGKVVDLTDGGQVIGFVPHNRLLRHRRGQELEHDAVRAELFVWKDGVRREIPTKALSGVKPIAGNDRGEIIGEAGKAGFPAVLYSGGRWHELAKITTLPEGAGISAAYDIDESGNVLAGGPARNIVYLLRRRT